jgi:hypothetical protein
MMLSKLIFNYAQSMLSKLVFYYTPWIFLCALSKSRFDSKTTKTQKAEFDQTVLCLTGANNTLSVFPLPRSSIVSELFRAYLPSTHPPTKREHGDQIKSLSM